MAEITKNELRAYLIEKYIEIARGFYFEGSDEETERKEYAPKWADEIIEKIWGSLND